MTRKSGLTPHEHCEIGAQLIENRKALSTLICTLSRRYPVNGKIVNQARRAAEAIRALRSELDNAAHAESSQTADANGPYFGDVASRLTKCAT